MEFGIGYFPTHDGVQPADLAALIEQHGQESLFVAEHSHTPASRESSYPGGGELPRKYNHTYDPFVALTSAATATSRLRIGTGVCLVNQRDPIHTAKQVASLDQISGGRFEFGIGIGWNREEMENHGTNPKTRVATGQGADRGDAADLDPGDGQLPRRVRQLRRHLDVAQARAAAPPPILVGGDGPTVLDRVLAYGDAWFPNWGAVEADIDQRAAELRSRAERPISLQIMGAPADPAVLERCEKLGADRVTHWLPSNGLGPVEAALEAWEEAVAEHLGQ